MTVFCGYFHDDENESVLAGYNGSEWITLSDSMSGTFNNVVDYESGILISGIGFLGTEQFLGLAYFDGSEWSYPWNFNDHVSKVEWVNDTLYAIGWFTEIDGQDAYRIARLVNGEWQGVLEAGTLNDSSINDVIYYNGEIYVGGLFQATNGVQKFARINGNELLDVAGGLSGANTGIRDFEVYNEELYLAGIIPLFQGNVGNHILRFNGETIQPVGEPFGVEPYVSEIAGNVQSIHSIDGYLYATGNFYYSGYEPMYGIARWDGKNWCGLFGNDFLPNSPPYNVPIRCSGKFQEKLLIYLTYYDDQGNFAPLWIYDGGDEVSGCSAPLSSTTDQVNPAISIYPNPVFQSSSSEVSITSYVNFSEISVFDLAGRLVLKERMASTSQYNLNIRKVGFSPGVYIVHLGGDRNQGAQKMVVLQ